MNDIEKVSTRNHLILANGEQVSLEEITRIKIILEPYLVFPVFTLTEVERELSLMKVIYPYTANCEVSKEVLVTGEQRPTRSIHYIEKETHRVLRKIDLKSPNKVQLTGHRNIIIELKDGTKKKVSFDGNCMNRMEGIDVLEHQGIEEPLVDFFDRASFIIEIAKQRNIPMASFI